MEILMSLLAIAGIVLFAMLKQEPENPENINIPPENPEYRYNKNSYRKKPFKRNFSTKAPTDFNDNFESTKQERYPPAEELPYTFRPLLTKTEFFFYRHLRAIADPYKIHVCPKVRLEDIIQVNCWNKKELYRFRGYIKSRHVDFLLCDRNMDAICAIELDDPSHNSKKAQDVDEFKNNVFKKINIALFRVKVAPDYKEKVKEIFRYAISVSQNAAEK